MLPVLSMLLIGGVLLGGASIRDFALALFVGLLLGTYSSIFVATPILVWLRSMESEARRSAKVEAARQARSGAERDDAAKFVDDRDASLVSPGGAAPRGRKKGKRK